MRGRPPRRNGSRSRECWLAALTLCASQARAQPAAAQSAAAQPAAAQSAAAQSAAGPEYSEPLVDVHAFVSQGFIKSTENEFLAKSKKGSFEFSEAGINVTRALGDKLRVGVQLFTRDLGAIGNYRARFDWYELDYHFFDWLGLRAGRTKLPYGLYNETSDIDAARVPILLPQSVYSINNRDFLLAQTGVELYGYVSLAGAGALDYRIYGGTLYLDLSDTASNRFASYEVPYLIGGRALYMPPLPGLSIGGTVQALRLDGVYTPSGAEDRALGRLEQRRLIPIGYVGPIAFELPVLLWLASVEYAVGDLALASEYGRGWLDTDVTSPQRASAPAVTSEHGFVMGSYRLSPWFVPGLYYSLSFPNVEDRKGRDAYQHDVALTLRFDLTQFWILKAETHYMHGTAGLDVALNDVETRAELADDWMVLLLKTTAYF
jgi:hypothetical protein